MGELICPNCGSKVALPEHSEICTGITFSKETNGIHYLNMEDKKVTKNEQRLEALKANGIDTSKYFNVQLPTGGEIIMEMKDGVPTPATLPEIRQQIIEDGYVRNTKLHRRFVMAQMFRMMGSKNWYTDGYNESLKALGYKYQFTMALEEFRVQTKLEGKDEKSFHDRNSFFNVSVAYDMAICFENDLSKYLQTKNKRKCKGIPYIIVGGMDIFCEDIDRKILNKVRECRYKIGNCKTIYQLYENFKILVGLVKKYKLPWNTPQSKLWQDAYKGSGAYYTLRNMVMYHDCKLNIYGTDEYVTGVDAIKYLEKCVNKYYGEGWRFMAMLRKCINDNNFVFKF